MEPFSLAGSIELNDRGGSSMRTSDPSRSAENAPQSGLYGGVLDRHASFRALFRQKPLFSRVPKPAATAILGGVFDEASVSMAIFGMLSADPIWCAFGQRLEGADA